MIHASWFGHAHKKKYIIYQSNTKVTCIIFVLEDGLANDYVMRE
jgi:hypothetical protein